MVILAFANPNESPSNESIRTNMNQHRKHAQLTRREFGQFAPLEIALLGTKCSAIESLAENIAERLQDKMRIAYADASHSDSIKPPHLDSFTFHPSGDLTTRGLYNRNPYTDRILFSRYDLVLINGNHYAGKRQILLLDREKEASVRKRLDQITDVQMVIRMQSDLEDFGFLLEKFPGLGEVPHFDLDQIEEIAWNIGNFVDHNTPPLRGLVLAGGQSQRMGSDKGLLQYFGKSQRSYTIELLQKCNLEAFLSVRKEQQVTEGRVIEDVFLGLGPFGAICSAFQEDPNSAWLVLATDLPYVDETLIRKLLSERDPSKVATAVKGRKKEFPEPLVTIWEPRAYPIMLQFLAQGISCPRKVLINSDVKLVETDEVYIYNVNTPEEYDSVRKDLEKR